MPTADAPAHRDPDLAARLEPDSIAKRSFGTSFRGYDTGEVRAYLATVAEAHRSLIERAEAAEVVAAGIIAEAESRAAEVLREAQDEAQRVLASVVIERERGFAEGASQAEEVLADAESSRVRIEEEARAEAERLVGEAKAARERVLGDLRRRRKTARVQVEQLHAAREKLLAALGDVRSSIDQTTTGLRDALPEAKAAADAAARRVEAEDDATTEQLEAEIEALRLAGLAMGAPLEAAPEPEPAAEAPAAVADPEPVIERFSSSVRIVRPMRTQDPVTGLPEEELLPLEAPDPEEAVRLVAPDAEPEPGTETEPAVAERDDADVAEAEAEPHDGGGPGDTRPSPEAVDALFARLKAGREQRVAPAETGAAAPPATDAEAESKAESESEVEPADAHAVHRGGGADRDALLARRDAAVAPATAALGRRLKRLLAEEQNELLDALRRAGTVDALPDPAAHDARWAAVATRDLTLAAAAGAAAFPATDEPAAEPTADDLAEVAHALAAAVARPLSDRLAQVIAEADGDAEVAADAVRATYRTWRSERIGPAVAHAVLDAFAAGVARACPAGTPVCWIADDGGVACPDAEDNALAGVVAFGEAFPTGHRRPPAHPGCRCLVVPSTADATTA